MVNSKSNKKPTSTLFFSDGCIVGADTIVSTGHFNAYPGADATRILFRFGTYWTYDDCRTDMLRSVAYSPQNGKCFLAGRNGLIRSYGSSTDRSFTLESLKGSMNEVTIPDVERFGEIFRVRAFAGHVFCCGQSAQVYRLQRGVWTHSDDGILSKRAQTLEDIHGTDADDVYAVGMAGTILHFNGSRWRELDSPTDQPLSSVRCARKGEVYICGNNGVFLRGDARGWEVIGSADVRMNFWGLDLVDDVPYLAHVSGIVKYENRTFTEVKLPVGHKISCNRLNASGERLLSVGVNDILLYDGNSWSEIIWPDNK
jgi:hypothetical protein